MAYGIVLPRPRRVAYDKSSLSNMTWLGRVLVKGRNRRGDQRLVGFPRKRVAFFIGLKT